MTASIRRLALASLLPAALLAACDGSAATSHARRVEHAYDEGPTQPGDDALVVLPITKSDVGDGDPPPPPLDTTAAFTAATGADPITLDGVAATYYLDDDSERGWIAFPQRRQPAGVTASPDARIVLRGTRMGGAGTLTVATPRGVLTIDLARQLVGGRTEIAGSCARRRGGACATIGVRGATFAPRTGAPIAIDGALDIGVPLAVRRTR